MRDQLLPFLIDNTNRTAISASKDYGREENQSQTVGFGLLYDESFEKFIKMGFLCGNRVVLWDFIGTRVLANLDGNPSVPDTVKTLATNLMPLKPIVEAGGLVMLPHPTDWSKEIRQNVSQKLQEIKKLYGPDTKITPEIFRLASALTATNEVNLYPYTFDRFGSFSPNEPYPELPNDPHCAHHHREGH